jgi:hypothetical protein
MLVDPCTVFDDPRHVADLLAGHEIRDDDGEAECPDQAAGERVRAPDIVPLDVRFAERYLVAPTKVHQQQIAWETSGLQAGALPDGYDRPIPPAAVTYRAVAPRFQATIRDVRLEAGTPHVALADVCVTYAADGTVLGGLFPIASRPGSQQTPRVAYSPHVNGGLRDNTPEQATALCREYGVKFNIENHPEKSAAEILGKIGGGNEWLGVCIDTGWLGTQGAPGPATIKACAPFVRHTHIKDVKAAGRHETCLLGEGSADVAGCMAALREIGYTGWYSWEDEPEDRNPMDSAVRNREWIEKRLAG